MVKETDVEQGLPPHDAWYVKRNRIELELKVIRSLRLRREATTNCCCIDKGVNIVLAGRGFQYLNKSCCASTWFVKNTTLRRKDASGAHLILRCG